MNEEKKTCFAIMPISDPSGYEEGHFLKVYQDVFSPAIEAAGYIPHRVDEDSKSGLIQTKIIQNLLEAPMAICDLSTRNPNVLFELGIRQAFNKPVVIVQQEGTERIFDVGCISCIDYDAQMSYRGVLKAREQIEVAIKTTEVNGFNSIINELNIKPANLSDTPVSDDKRNQLLLYMLLNKVDQMNEDLQKIKSAYNANQRNASRQTLLRSLPKEQLETLAYIEARNRLYQEKNDKKIDEEKTLGEQLAELNKKK